VLYCIGITQGQLIKSGLERCCHVPISMPSVPICAHLCPSSHLCVTRFTRSSKSLFARSTLQTPSLLCPALLCSALLCSSIFAPRSPDLPSFVTTLFKPFRHLSWAPCNWLVANVRSRPDRRIDKSTGAPPESEAEHDHTNGGNILRKPSHGPALTAAALLGNPWAICHLVGQSCLAALTPHRRNQRSCPYPHPRLWAD